MPVLKSSKRSLRTAKRRHEENLVTKELYKKAVKGAKKALQTGAEGMNDLFSKAQSALDRAAKKHTIHPNKAARLKSRMAKQASGIVAAPEKKRTTAKKAAPKKTAAKKTPSKKK